MNGDRRRALFDRIQPTAARLVSDLGCRGIGLSHGDPQAGISPIESDAARWGPHVHMPWHVLLSLRAWRLCEKPKYVSGLESVRAEEECLSQRREDRKGKNTWQRFGSTATEFLAPKAAPVHGTPITLLMAMTGRLGNTAKNCRIGVEPKVKRLLFPPVRRPHSQRASPAWTSCSSPSKMRNALRAVGARLDRPIFGPACS
jgi:hypothetical protein